MYNVTDSFRTMMKRGQHVEHIRGQVGQVALNDHNLIGLEYSNKCSDSSDVKFGSVYIGQINAEIVNISIPRGSWRGLKLYLEYGLELAEPEIEWIPIGVFTISEAVWTARGITITAYDCLADLDRPFTASTTYGTPYDLLALAAELSGVELGQSQSEIDALPNGTELLGLYANNDIATIRDYVAWIASSVGGFATSDRSGRLVIKSWSGLEVVESLTAHDRIAGSIFSDFATDYSGITIEDQNSGGLEYYLVPDASGPVVALGANPFLQYGIDKVKDAQRQRIAEVAASIKYTPFSVSLLNNPAYDLGDLIYCETGVAGDEPVTCCVMAINWQLKQTVVLQGFGKDPNLAAGKSSTEKALNGLKNKTTENEVVTHTFVNSQAYTIRDSRTRILRIKFSTLSPRTITLLHEINLDLTITDPSGVATCTAYYYLDGELESYKPVASWNNDGMHILSLMYFLKDLIGGAGYEWAVWLKIDGGTAFIDREKVHAILQGQGLVALDKFDGIIELTDEIEPYVLGLDVASLTDRVVALSAQAPRSVSASNQMQAYVLGVPMASITDSRVSLTAVPVQFTRITEDSTDEEEIVRVLEDGGIRLTEG